MIGKNYNRTFKSISIDVVLLFKGSGTPTANSRNTFSVFQTLERKTDQKIQLQTSIRAEWDAPAK